MNKIPASQEVCRRLKIASRRLGTVNPAESIGDLLERTFELPMNHPLYGTNALVPGSMPMEHSFSENAAQTLRLDMEPLGPQATPIAKRNEASRIMRRLVHANYGSNALGWFDSRSEQWRGSSLPGDATFGAFFGASYSNHGLQNAKVYYELGPGDLEALPPNLKHAVNIAMGIMPNLVPLFVSITCGLQRGAMRVYFTHRGELRLLDLEPLMHRLGIGHQLPGLLAAIGLIVGGRFTLPENAVVLGIRDTTKGIELKLEILVPGLPDPPQQMHGLINMHLAQRPESQRALRHWMQAMTPDEANSCGAISTVSARVTPSTGVRLSVYFRPIGYETRRNGQRYHTGTNQDDPYAFEPVVPVAV